MFWSTKTIFPSVADGKNVRRSSRGQTSIFSWVELNVYCRLTCLCFSYDLSIFFAVQNSFQRDKFDVWRDSRIWLIWVDLNLQLNSSRLKYDVWPVPNLFLTTRLLVSLNLMELNFISRTSHREIILFWKNKRSSGKHFLLLEILESNRFSILT